MAMFTRVSRMFRADINAVLDRIEEPDVLLRQAVRDMQEQLSLDRGQLVLRRRDLAQLLERKTRLQASVAPFEQELDLCFDAGNESLARSLLRRKLENERMISQLDHKEKELKAVLEQGEQSVRENAERLAVMQEKADSLCEAIDPVGAFYDVAAHDPVVRDDEVEVAFLREQQRRRPA